MAVCCLESLESRRLRSASVTVTEIYPGFFELRGGPENELISVAVNQSERTFGIDGATYSDVSVLPTTAFFYGLKPGEEISVSIEEGKVLIIRLISIGQPDKDGRRAISYELNGIGRETFILDKTVAPKTKARPKADLNDVSQVAAPIPGLIAQLQVSVGGKVAKGDKLLMMEAMKMQNTVYAPCDGVIAELHVALGDTVEAKDLLIKIRTAAPTT